METITIPKEKYEKIINELEVLRATKLYKRLLEFDQNILSGKKFKREDLGF